MSHRILIVDDSKTVRLAIRQTLSEAGYEVIEAETGTMALELAKKERLDLILLDLELPGLNGFEVLRFLKGMPAVKEVPVLAITGIFERLEDIHRLKTLGAAGYIRKDTAPGELVFRVRHALTLPEPSS